ncbi:MAG: DNA polymerase IV, partial [Nevskiaceae bacterium]
PEAVFVPPDFTRYKAASRQTREIFHRHTDLVEPLSLDEAYLDVTSNKTGLPTATAVAKAIRAQIREELQLTASAGVAPNKFLAKLASDVRKPDGLFVILPDEIDAFLPGLPVGRIPGVGKVTDAQLGALGIRTIGELRELSAGELERRFGKYGKRLYEFARGIDDHPVVPNQPTQSISAEDTFERDQTLDAMESKIRGLAAKVWEAAQQEHRVPHTVVLKLKTHDFKVLTRSLTPQQMPATAAELAEMALSLRERVGRPARSLYRLVGVGLSNFRDQDEAGERQPQLFQDQR